MNPAPIGIFDSGVGGLTVWYQIKLLLPNEDIIYFADSLNCPYGNKSQPEIINLSRKITEFLIAKNCKLIVVACNTATAAAIDTLRAEYPVPFVGMEPAIKPAALKTSTGKIGVLATKGTFEGRLFQETSKKYTKNIYTHIQIGEGLVEFVEANNYRSPEARTLLKKYIDPMVDAGVDQIVLGCTHYPFYKEIIEEIVGPGVQVLDPAPAVARRTQALLEELTISNSHNQKGKDSFFSSGDTLAMKNLLESFSIKNSISEILINN
jgi:glutamate racemase